MKIFPGPIAKFEMYTYSFNIYKDDNPHVYMAIFLQAKDRNSPYESILIRMGNEEPEDWSSSVEDSCKKKGPYSGRPFFKWLSNQHLAIPSRISPFDCSPHDLYNVLDRSVEYDVLVDTDDPADIGDPGHKDDDMYDPGIVY